MKVLLLFAFVIFAVGIKILYDLRHAVTYQQTNRNYNVRQKCDKPDVALEYLFCLPLKGELALLANRTELDLEKLNEELLNYFQGDEFGEKKRIKFENLWTAMITSDTVSNLIIRPLKHGNYYLLNEKICFATQDYSAFVYAAELTKLFEKESLFVFRKETGDLYRLSSPKKLVNVAIMANGEHPKLNCDRSRFQCLNDCFKKGRRLSKYFYDGNETGVVYLDSNEQDESVKNQEKLCFDQCAEDCESTYFSFSTVELEVRTRKFTARPVIVELDFWLQLTALLLLFIAISLAQCHPKSINQTFFRRMLLSICLVPVLILLFILYKDRYPSADEREKAALKEISFKQPQSEPLKLTVCVGLGNILLNDYEKSKSEFKESRKFYQNKTFAQLERETDGAIEATVHEIYLKFLNKRKEVHWTLSPRVLFLGYSNNVLYRCFEIVVNPKEPLYQSLLSSTRLELNFKHQQYLVSAGPVNASSNAENSDSDFENSLREKGSRRWERIVSGEDADCMDYGQHYANCDSKQNCFELCVNRELLNRFGKIADYYMIYKDQLSEKEWSTVRIEDTMQPHQIPKKIQILCEDKFRKNDCYSTAFISVGRSLARDWSVSLRKVLPYDLTKEFEEKRSPSALPSELLITQGVFLALNLFRLVCVVGLLKLKARKIELLHRLIYAICLIALLAHLIHIFWRATNEALVYDEHYETPKTIQMPEAVMCFERLNVTEHDSSEEEEVEEEDATATYNETVSDVAIDKVIDGEAIEANSTTAPIYTASPSRTDTYQLSMNYADGELTGSRLEELTSDLRPEKIFDKILYLDKASNQWISLDSTSNFTNDEIALGRFFLQGKKCFSVRNRQLNYDRDRFAFLQDQKIGVLKVLLNESFRRELREKFVLLVSFGTKKPFKSEFTNFADQLNDVFVEINQKSLVKMTVRNYFSWLNPFAFLADAGDQLDSYFAKLKEAFKMKYNMTTLSLPLEESDSNEDFSFLKISNESLFESFYEEYVERNGLPIDPKHPKWEYARNQMYEWKRDYDFKLSLTFAEKIIEQSNAGAYSKLALYLLNALIALLVFGLFDRCIRKLSRRF